MVEKQERQGAPQVTDEVVHSVRRGCERGATTHNGKLADELMVEKQERQGAPQIEGDNVHGVR